MNRRMSLATQFLLFQLVIMLLVVSAVAAVSLAASTTAFRRDVGSRLRSVAEHMAGTDSVRVALLHRDLLDTLATAAESTRTSSGASFVLVADAQGVLLTGPNLGRPATLGGSDVLTGRSWVGQVEDGARALVAHAPILSEDTFEVIGFVAVGQYYPTLPQLIRDSLGDLTLYLLLAGVIGLVGSLLLARFVTRQTLGLEPREIVGLVEHREAMLHGIKEGIIATDSAHNVTLVNDEAVRLLQLDGHPIGRPLASYQLEERLLDVLTGRVTGTDQVVLRGSRVLVLNQMPVVVRGRRAGSVTTLRDRTELTALERELHATRTTTDTLRAQAHDFANRLHTISGLVQLGEYDEVVRFINLATQRHQALTKVVTDRLADPALAALLIAKASLAAEQGVELRLSPDSALCAVDDDLVADLMTIVGNLVDNALDAVGSGGWVEVGLRGDEGEVRLSVCDSGPGVAPELVDEVFRQGYTTKAAANGQRGLGLALARSICTRRGGTIAVSGSTFRATLPTQSVEPS